MDPGGVTAEADFTGGHLFHLAAAGCVLNDLYQEAAALGIEVKRARVTAAGGFDTVTWQSTGISYSVEVSSDAPGDQLAHLLEVADQVAEIPQAIRAGNRSAGDGLGIGACDGRFRGVGSAGVPGPGG